MIALELKLTESCNLDCAYCYYRVSGDTSPGPSPTMSRGDMRRSIDFFSARSRRKGAGGLNVTFFGGEPLLLSDDIVDLVEEYGGSTVEGEPLRFFVCTNGTLLDDALLDRLEKLGIGIFLSLDGPRDVHDLNRHDGAGRGSFGAIEALLPRLAVACIATETVIARNALGSAADSLEWLVERGFRKIVAIPDFQAEWTPDDLAELERQYRLMAELFAAHVAAGDPFSFSLFSDQITLEASGHSYREQGCSIGIDRFVVGPDLAVHPCTRFATRGGLAMGDIHSGIREDLLSEMRARHGRDRPECAGCGISRRCLGNNCACLSSTLTGRWDGVSPLLCEHGRMLARVVDGIPALVDAASRPDRPPS